MKSSRKIKQNAGIAAEGYVADGGGGSVIISENRDYQRFVPFDSIHVWLGHQGASPAYDISHCGTHPGMDSSKLKEYQ